jgi:hypothetical protein
LARSYGYDAQLWCALPAPGPERIQAIAARTADLFLELYGDRDPKVPVAKHRP